MLNEAIKKAIDDIKRNAPEISRKKALFGFDGFVDTIVRPIRKGTCQKVESFFNNIPEFGAYLLEKSGKGCSIELEETTVKIGGNMPITSNALGYLGVKVNCVGAFGYPDIKDVFEGMSPNCNIISIEEPGICLAMEFDDSKIMFALNKGTNSVTWDAISERVGIDKLGQLFNQSDIVGLFNWGELPGMTGIFKGLAREIGSNLQAKKDKTILFDLSDCSRRTKEEILEAIEVLPLFNAKYKVVLSLNDNEARNVYKALGGKSADEDLRGIGSSLYSSLNVDKLVLHPIGMSYAWDGIGSYMINNYHIASPKITTGGGDNFNAGLCFAELLGLDMEESLVTASAAASFYVDNGQSATVTELLEFLYRWLGEM